MKKICLFTLLLCNLFFCRPKERGIVDPKWREESQKIASDICTKLQSCSTELINKIKPSLQTYTQSNLKSENCAEKNKKSRVYSLIGENPDFIKNNVRKCHTIITEMSCQDIVNGSLQKVESCLIMKKIQSGQKL